LWRVSGTSVADFFLCARFILLGCSAVDAEQEDVKDEGGAAGDDVADAGLAVGHVGRDDQSPLLADAHAQDTGVPALDHLADAQREVERLITID
jgi:hypothetical protein